MAEVDCWDDDFSDGVPRAPSAISDVDLSWTEGSLGTRNAKRDVRSNRSSSISALSPSLSSAFTADSEDELDGLVLPAGPLRLEQTLKNRKHVEATDNKDPFGEKQPPKAVDPNDDFFNDIDLGDGEVFDTGKPTLNRNVQHKVQIVDRTTRILDYGTVKNPAEVARPQRFPSRPRSKLEPVSESGVAVSRYSQPWSRYGGHSTQSSISSIPAPAVSATQTTSTTIPAPATHAVPGPATTATSSAIPVPPSTPSRRTLRTAESRNDMRNDAPTTTNSQLLKAKRSMPVMRNLNSPIKAISVARPPSRQGADRQDEHARDEGATPSRIPARPQTPTERVESRLGAIRKAPAPFLPAGVSTTQSQHISLKTSSARPPGELPGAAHYAKRFQRLDGSNDPARPSSRIAGRPESGARRGSLTPAEVVTSGKKPVTKPIRRRHFGDGRELEIFDDLPTSATVESKFIKQPVSRPGAIAPRVKLSHSLLNSPFEPNASNRVGNETPMPQTPASPPKQLSKFGFPNENVPRFARDTAASRLSREQRQMPSPQHHGTFVYQNMRGNPLQPIQNTWKPNLARAPIQKPTIRKRGDRSVQQKPHLIKPMGGEVSGAKIEKGMHYNPLKFRWEGNENDVDPFDVPEFHPRGQSPGGSPNSKPPALITNKSVGATGGVQVVGGMVFDPRRMCWLKMAEDQQQETASKVVGNLKVEEEEDVFAGLEDLKEEDEQSMRSGRNADESKWRSVSQRLDDHVETKGDEFDLGEEFDVGPAFIKRQRGEEEKWKKKVEKWLRPADDEGLPADGRGGWRWAIRDLVMAEP